MVKVVQKAEMEKGPLWGTKLAFFRRKEIRVSLLPILLQSPCHFDPSTSFLLKRSIQGGFAPFYLFPRKGRRVQFFVLFPHVGWRKTLSGPILSNDNNQIKN
jgi:hypothetical protein